MHTTTLETLVLFADERHPRTLVLNPWSLPVIVRTNFTNANAKFVPKLTER